ncbi:insulin gene enhancer protein ISL-2 [Trichonephila clavipes]|nr:insulin gene enhancer protein ISL-2 [Trichonephila clavipes]
MFCNIEESFHFCNAAEVFSSPPNYDLYHKRLLHPIHQRFLQLLSDPNELKQVRTAMSNYRRPAAAFNAILTCCNVRFIISCYICTQTNAESMQTNRNRDSVRPQVHKQSSDHKPTRVRTVLNEKQLHTLRTCYAANPRPDALMKEQLVEMTGLSPRVIRVWFQNKRCKDKKKNLMMKQLQQQEKVSIHIH